MGAAARGTSSPLGVEAKWAFKRIASRIGSVLDILTGSAAFHVLGERGSEDRGSDPRRARRTLRRSRSVLDGGERSRHRRPPSTACPGVSGECRYRAIDDRKRRLPQGAALRLPRTGAPTCLGGRGTPGCSRRIGVRRAPVSPCRTALPRSCDPVAAEGMSVRGAEADRSQGQAERREPMSTVRSGLVRDRHVMSRRGEPERTSRTGCSTVLFSPPCPARTWL